MSASHLEAILAELKAIRESCERAEARAIAHEPDPAPRTAVVRPDGSERGPARGKRKGSAGGL